MNLAQKSGVIQFDKQTCEGAELEDIDRDKVNWYLERREELRQIEKPEKLSSRKLLLNLNAAQEVNGKFHPTNAGILFFGKNPQKFLVQSQLRLVKFKGIKLTKPVIDRLDCSGT